MTDFQSFQRAAQLNSDSASAFRVTLADGRDVALEVSTFGPGVFRLRLAPRADPDYGLLVATPDAKPDLHANEGTLKLRAGDATLTLQSNPLRFGLSQHDQVLTESTLDEHFRGWSRVPCFGLSETQAAFALALDPEEPIYGLGEKFTALNKRSQLVRSRVEDALGVNTELAYKNTPFAWSPRGWGVLALTTADVQHGVGYAQWSSHSYTLVVDSPSLDLVLFAFDDPADLLAAYTRLTGRAPRVPLWSLGVWVSRAYYRTSDEILAAAQTLRDKRFPADVITYDGRAWQDTPTRFHFHWDESRYPDVQPINDQLHAAGFKICCWEYPYVSVHHPDYADYAAKGYFLKTKEGAPYVFDWDKGAKTSPFGKVLTPLPPSSIVDFTSPAAYAWWRDAHQAVFALGCDTLKSDFGEHVPADAVAFNGDSGEALHNVYPHLYNRCVWEASVAAYGDQACLWGRAGWIGAQRYPVQWGGDPQSSWDGLAASIRGALSYGMSGAPYHASDVGGFYGAAQPSPALYVRWVQAAVFSSHFRIHGIGEREPWCFGAEAESICRYFFELRYRLLPYLMGACEAAADSGLPVMRAMAIDYPDDRVAQAYPHQFMCGESLLVMPILNAQGTVQGWLPEHAGGWYDLWTGAHYDDNEILNLDFDLERIPVFVKAGHAIALGPLVQSTQELGTEAKAERVVMFGAGKPQMHTAAAVKAQLKRKPVPTWVFTKD